MYEQWLQKRKEAIITNYKKMYTIFFRYGIFLVSLGMAFYTTQTILQQETNIISLGDNASNEKSIKIKAFKKWIDEIKSSGDLVIFVGLWSLTKSWNFIFSYNNLASYHWYVLPRYFEEDLTLFPEKWLFDGTGYSKDDLGNFVWTLRNIKNKSAIVNREKELLPINTDIITTFNLQCLSQKKIYNGICDIFTQNFVDSFLLYDITQDLAGFNKIFSTILETQTYKYQDQLCKNLIYYGYYSSNGSNDIKSIMKMCRPSDYDRFNKFSLFSEIQKELESKSISSTVYEDTIINQYKTISFLQILYEDITNSKINIDRINHYLDFIEELLKQGRNKPLQTNIIYYFNNYELKKALENPELFIKINNKTELNNILKRINKINNGNILIGYKGIKYSVNPNILISDNETQSNKIQDNPTEIIDKLLWQIDNFVIDQKIISWDQILAKWILSIIGQDGSQIWFPIKIWFKEQSSVLFIKQIEIPWQADLNTSINEISNKAERSFGDLQKYFSLNTNLITVAISNSNELSGSTNFCNAVQEALSGWISIEKCTDKLLYLSRTWNNKVIWVGINYENYIFKNIDVSDNDAKNIITEYLKKPSVVSKYRSINQTNMPMFANEIMSIFNPVETKDPVVYNASANTLLILETVKKYLGVEVTDIAEKGTKVAITFALSGINLIGTYNINTHTIEQLYFKDIKNNDLPAQIQNTQVILDDAHINDLKALRKDPIGYFKDKSKENYLLYMKNK